MNSMLIGLFPLVPGIGHKIKSVNNPDLRVELVKAFAKKEFPSCDTLDYAIAVEKVTSSKKDVSPL
jgi:ATP citrate (pro-S)-lyase